MMTCILSYLHLVFLVKHTPLLTGLPPCDLHFPGFSDSSFMLCVDGGRVGGAGGGGVCAWVHGSLDSFS